MLLAIEGIDGAGKGTLCKAILTKAQAKGIRAASLSFPRYGETQFSEVVAKYLRGEMGSIDQVPVRYAALLYGGDRFESRDRLLALIAENDLVVLDRYVHSNIAYNAAKLPLAEQIDLANWIEQLEFGMFELPRPDLILLLSTSPHLADRLVERKSKRSYTNETRDMHETDREYLSRVSKVYGRLAEMEGNNWLSINPIDKLGDLSRPEDIAEKVWQHSALSSIRQI